MTPWPTAPLAVALALLACMGGPLSGQSESAERLRRTVSSLGDSTRMRLLAPGIVVDDGYFLGLVDDSVRVGEADALMTVGLDEIEALSVQGSKWLSVGLQTAAVTTVVGAVAGFFWGAKDCGTEPAGCEREALGRSARWGLGFGLAGGLAGGVAGSRMRGWREVFP